MGCKISKALFCILIFMVSMALIADMESGFGTLRHAMAVIVPVLFISALAIFGAGYCAMAYIFWMDERRRDKMTKQELEREYLARVAGVWRRK